MLPPDVQFYEDLRLFVRKPRGVLNEAALNEVLASLEDLEARLQAPFNRFTDALGAAEVELNFEYVIQVSLHRRLAYAGRPLVKSAILATNTAAIDYGRLHPVLPQGSPIKVRVLELREEVAQWLDVPIALLRADPPQELQHQLTN